MIAYTFFFFFFGGGVSLCYKHNIMDPETLFKPYSNCLKFKAPAFPPPPTKSALK